MKFTPLIFVFSLLFLTACQESSSKKSSSSTNNNQYTCPAGYISTYQGCVPGTTSGGTTGNTNSCYVSAYAYHCVTGCPGVGTNQHLCGTTTGTTNGGTTGGTTPPTNTCPGCPTTNLGGWTGKYPGGVPAGSCQAAVAPSGATYTPYETRKASMTIVGRTWYNPADPAAPNYMNTSAILKSVANARTLFETDSVLKVRFKVRQQPESSSSNPYCYNRASGSPIAGYHKLQFSVTMVGVRANGSVETEPVPGSPFEIGVNSCTPAIDLTSAASLYPGGIYLRVEGVRGNQLYFPDDYAQYGFRNMTGFSDIRSSDCWSLDVEVAADGTKTFE